MTSPPSAAADDRRIPLLDTSEPLGRRPSSDHHGDGSSGGRSGRLLDRDAPFKQSTGVFRIQRDGKNRKLIWSDVYHTVLHASLARVLLLVFVFYNVLFVAYALLYMWASDACDLGLDGDRAFLKAYYFSVETMMTIGYGVGGHDKADPFFGACASNAVLIMTQSLLGILADCICFGLVFARMSLPQWRASTVVFSDKAFVTRVRGALYLSFRVAEMRRHQLVEAHVRPSRFCRTLFQMERAALHGYGPDAHSR